MELARCEIALQMRLRDAFARTKEFPTSAGIAQVRGLAKSGAKWRPSRRLICEGGKSCPVSRDDETLRHDALCPAWGGRCLGAKCCMDCPSGANAKDRNACDQMCARAKQYRTDKNAAEKQAEEAKEEKKQRGYRAAIQRDAQRIARAADAASLPDKQKLQLEIHRYPPIEVGKIRSWANGDFGDAHFCDERALRVDERQVKVLCANLRCSADYLLGLTDELTPVSKSDTAVLPEGAFRMAWRTDRDFPDGPVLLLISENGSLSYETDDVQDGNLSWFDEPDDGEILRWLPLPPEEEGSI